MALLYGRAGCLTAKNGGFRPGQSDRAKRRSFRGDLVLRLGGRLNFGNAFVKDNTNSFSRNLYNIFVTFSTGRFQVGVVTGFSQHIAMSEKVWETYRSPDVQPGTYAG